MVLDMKKLIFCEKKTLRLTNVLSYDISFEEENLDISVCVEQMQSYIQVKGVRQVGPLIQHISSGVGEDGQMDVKVRLLLQCDSMIHVVENPYRMESLVRVTDALYCRYIGPESMLKTAYDKINVEAFEQDISLENSNYTVFVDNNEEEGTITADVFVPRTFRK